MALISNPTHKSQQNIDLTAYILAGGFGTRLVPSIGATAKVLAPVANHTFLELQMENWVAQGLKKFVFLLHYESKSVITALSKLKQNFGSTISIDHEVEEHPLGTGGAVTIAAKKRGQKEPFLVLNADTWFKSGLKLISEQRRPSVGVAWSQDVSRFGSVALDQHMTVLSFKEKLVSSEPGFVNAGVFLLYPDDIMLTEPPPFSLEAIILTRLINHHKLFGFELDTDFIDIGTPNSYEHFKKLVDREML